MQVTCRYWEIPGIAIGEWAACETACRAGFKPSDARDLYALGVRGNETLLACLQAMADGAPLEWTVAWSQTRDSI